MNVLSEMFDGFLSGPAQNPLALIALRVLQQNGGLQQLLVKCQNAGLGPQMQSWISSAQNIPIDTSALVAILGEPKVAELATKLGLTHEQVTGGLAQVLPQVVDHLTPQGQIPEGPHDVVAELLQRLSQKAG